MLFRTVTVSLVALLVATLVPSPAQARQVALVFDPHGDIDHPVDIWRVKVKHTDRVRVRIKHDNLVRHPERAAGVSVFLDTKRSTAGPDYVLHGGVFRGTDYALLTTNGTWRAKRMVMNCFYEMKLDFVRDVTKLVFDRDCFDDPRRVRAAVRVSADSPDGTTGSNDWMLARRAFTPWLRQTEGNVVIIS